MASTVQAATEQSCDFFCYLGEANKASLVMLVETDLVPKDLAGEIARGVTQVIAEQDQPGAKRSSNYLDFEARLLEIAGAEASRIHTGRSRQDLHGTVRRMLLRDQLLRSYESLLATRAVLLDFVETHADTVIPAYTHGVQAQPVSIGHYALAFSASMDRDAQRLAEAYARLNLSPLGAAALGTSGFNLDRERLAQLLGFSAPVENSYDANLVSSSDVRIELANVLAQSAVSIGQFVQNIHTQYHSPMPWFLLDRSVTDVSSIWRRECSPMHRPSASMHTIQTPA
ncbi:MAG: lyase family protein [Gammaproteobacteria bacterium]|nr:lyase family protein [Gammaproteobacteria bacterium]